MVVGATATCGGGWKRAVGRWARCSKVSDGRRMGGAGIVWMAWMDDGLGWPPDRHVDTVHGGGGGRPIGGVCVGVDVNDQRPTVRQIPHGDTYPSHV